MHYILFYDVADDFMEKRGPFRRSHLDMVLKAHERGDLVIAGALTEPVDGAVLVFRGSSPQVAEDFAKSDPYVANGIVKTWRVRKWTVTVGDGASLPPLPDTTGNRG